MADEMLLGGQRVVPSRALAEGFTFAYPELDAALRHALGR
jgi:NAD dependent epimerase/dehydratase family enzyme